MSKEIVKNKKEEEEEEEEEEEDDDWKWPTFRIKKSWVSTAIGVAGIVIATILYTKGYLSPQMLNFMRMHPAVNTVVEGFNDRVIIPIHKEMDTAKKELTDNLEKLKETVNRAESANATDINLLRRQAYITDRRQEITNNRLNNTEAELVNVNAVLGEASANAYDKQVQIDNVNAVLGEASANAYDKQVQIDFLNQRIAQMEQVVNNVSVDFSQQTQMLQNLQSEVEENEVAQKSVTEFVGTLANTTNEVVDQIHQINNQVVELNNGLAAMDYELSSKADVPILTEQLNARFGGIEASINNLANREPVVQNTYVDQRQVNNDQRAVYNTDQRQVMFQPIMGQTQPERYNNRLNQMELVPFDGKRRADDEEDDYDNLPIVSYSKRRAEVVD